MLFVLVFSLLVGFVGVLLLLLVMKWFLCDKMLYEVFEG